jgi:hypothetical protein
METQLVNFLIMERYNGIVRTDEITHPAADACMRRICTLLDAMIDTMDIAGLILQTNWNIHNALPVDVQFNSPNGTNRRTTPAESAFLFIPENAPGQVFCA